jgi:chloride channel 2
MEQAIAALSKLLALAAGWDDGAAGWSFAAGGGTPVDFLLLLAFRVAGCVAAVFCTMTIAPFAAGSGIPELRCILSGIDLQEHMRLRTLVAKVVGLVIMAGVGMPIGREGPLVHIAGIIGVLLLKLKHFDELEQSVVKRTEVLEAAAATGVAAAFGAPVGGVLFSIEVTASFFLTNSYWRSFVSAVSGCVLYRALSWTGWGLESSRLRTDMSFSAPLQQTFSTTLPMHVLLGVICGLGAAAFVRFYGFLFTWTRPHLRGAGLEGTFKSRLNGPQRTSSNLYKMARTVATHSYRKYIFAVTVAVLTAVLDFWGGDFMRGGQMKTIYDLVVVDNLTATNTSALPADFDYSKLQQLHAHGEEHKMNLPEMMDWDRWGVVGSLLVVVACKFVTTAFTLNLSVPCGVLAPTFLIGAALGRAFGELVGLHSAGFGAQLAPTDFAAAGAAAFVGGVTGTVSISVIVFELTNQIHFSLPLLVAVLVSRYVTSLLSDSVYDTVLRLGKLPNLPNGPGRPGAVKRH